MQGQGMVAVDTFTGNHKVVRTSIDRLIKKELLVGHGSKTPHKMYIREVRLTRKGRMAAKELQPKQQKLL